MSDPAERIFAEIFQDYTRRLRTANAFDFDDLLAQTVYLFRAFPHVADTYRRRFPACARRRVPRHEPRAIPADPRAHEGSRGRLARRRRRHDRADARTARGRRLAHGRRRLRPVDLCIPRRRHPQHHRVRARLHRCEGRAARTELPLEPEHPRRRERRDPQQLRPQGQEAVDGSGHRSRGRRLHRLLAARRGAVRRRRDRRAAAEGRRLQRDGCVLSHELAVARARRDLHPLGDSVPHHGRHEVLRPRRDQGRARLSRRGRQPRRRDGGPAHPEQAEARDRRGHRDEHRDVRRRQRPVVPRCACAREGDRSRSEAAVGARASRRGAAQGDGDPPSRRGRCAAERRRGGSAATAEQIGVPRCAAAVARSAGRGARREPR